jgi:S1-C subfamily serine protease
MISEYADKFSIFIAQMICSLMVCLITSRDKLSSIHVVADTDTVPVTLKDGRSFEGKVVGVDPVTDIAAVKIFAHKLPIVKLGNSQNLIPGQYLSSVLGVSPSETLRERSYDFFNEIIRV